MTDDRDLAAELGVTPVVLLQHAARDHRILAEVALQHGGKHSLARWFAAGTPEADYTRLRYRGSDEVRDNVVGFVLNRVPTAVQWFAVANISWIEVGRDSSGWAGPPLPLDDHRLPIALCGVRTDAELQSICAHEVAHQWSRMIATHPEELLARSHREALAHQLVLAQRLGVAESFAVDVHVEGEALADDLASLWGFPRRTDRRAIRARRVAELDAVRPLAARLAARGVEPTSGFEATLNADPQGKP